MATNVSNRTRGFFIFESSHLIYTLDDVIFRYWYFGYLCGVVYLVLIFGLERWLRERKPYKLKWFAIFWNLCLTILNALPAARILPYLVSNLQTSSFYASVCIDRALLGDPVCGFWVRMFPYQKIIELGDTVLLVLQKRKLTTYFWTHHLGALLITWYLYPLEPTAAVWISFIIDAFHVPVYLYCTVRSFKIKLSKKFTAAMILLEIFHMLVHLTLSAFMYYYIVLGKECTIATYDIALLSFMYCLCLVLSALTFNNRFLKKKKQSIKLSSATIDTVVTK